VTDQQANLPAVAAPAATGNAGAQVEAKVGAFYLLTVLAGSEPRGLPGSTARRVQFQRLVDGRPFDDIVVFATNADGSPAILELQVKRTIDFTAIDEEFRDVVRRMWAAAQKPDFSTSRYELAVAISRTSTRIERHCQEVLHWARRLTTSAEFAAHIGREGFSNAGMRGFVDIFRQHLRAAGAPDDDETVWRLLRRFQILVFDFEAPGSDFEHRARERARLILAPEQTDRATDLWPLLVTQAQTLATASGDADRTSLLSELQSQYGLRFDTRADLRSARARLTEAARDALAAIKDAVGGVRLSRTEHVDQAEAALDRVRVLKILGAGGVGKSHILKHLVERLSAEGVVVVLAPGRIVPGGWLQMQRVIDCPVSRDELFNELGCGGAATLFVDNIDQIADPREWATTADLLAGVAACPGWRAVVTASPGGDEWVARLPEGLDQTVTATLAVGEISDAETAVLSEGNPTLALLLDNRHPARRLARNLFYLSRMVEFAGPGAPAASIASEIDLARTWWRFGGGRSEHGRLARLQVLRAIAAEVVAQPGRAVFRTDAHDPEIVERLIQLDSLREERPGSTVAFRHDVLRDWAVGFLLDEEPERLRGLPANEPIPGGLARALEIAARLAIEGDATGGRWLSLLAFFEQQGAHGSWRRPVLLALPRSEQALAHFVQLESLLLNNDGRLLGELIRLMMAVESEPLANRLTNLPEGTAVPALTADLMLPVGFGWTWLVMWVLARADTLPSALIPLVSKLFQRWLLASHGQSLPTNARIIELLFLWLTQMDEALQPMMARDIQDAPEIDLKFPHLREVRDDVRATFFAFCHLNAPLAERYLTGLDPDRARHNELRAILRAPGALVTAAPRALTDFALATIIEREDPDERYWGGNSRFGPFGIHDYHLSPRSPGQGPFFELLDQASAEGLRLVRGLIEHATEWRRQQYTQNGEPFPVLTLPFPDGAKSFAGDFEVYRWGRGHGPSTLAASALMALEAWGHRQVEAGRSFTEVLHDILGPSGSSVAFACVAVDVALSHWETAHAFAWPLVASAELLRFDEARHTRDVTGVDRIVAFEPEWDSWRVKRAELEARTSRGWRLSDCIPLYVFNGPAERLDQIQTALRADCERILQDDHAGEDPINGLAGTAKRVLRMTDARHWPLVTARRADGSETQVHQYQRDPEEDALLADARAHSQANLLHMNRRLAIQHALLNPERSTATVVADGIQWAQSQSTLVVDTPSEDDDEDDDFDKECDRRAIVMAAALAVRDYDGADRTNVLTWAEPVLYRAAITADREYHGNDQIEYNVPAIAAVGLCALYQRAHNAQALDALLRLTTYPHPAVLNAISGMFVVLAGIDPRLPRSFVRIVMTAAGHPRTTHDERGDAENNAAYQRKIASAIEAEQSWLANRSAEPAWPALPTWPSRRRRGIRIGGGDFEVEDDEDRVSSDYYVDEHALGAAIGHLTPFAVGNPPAWVVALASELMRWTASANGTHGRHDSEREPRPDTWNNHFFRFAGILAVALPHEQVVETFLQPMTRFSDEPFHDTAAAFLRGFDAATFAPDAGTPEDAPAVRTLLAGRVKQSRAFAWHVREKSFRLEYHLSNAICALYFQGPRLVQNGRPNLPEHWDGLIASIPALTALVAEAPQSGYLALAFLNLIECQPHQALVPHTVQAAAAWCAGYGPDPHFWVEQEIGPRLCRWLNQALGTDEPSQIALASVCDRLVNVLDVLITAGVAEARAIEDRIVAVRGRRRSA
jgi:hypothetical protein